MKIVRYLLFLLLFPCAAWVAWAQNTTFWPSNSSSGGSGAYSGTFTGNVTGDVTGAITDQGGQVFNVKAYGATGDGTTDDSAAIVAIQAAATSGGIMYFPPGRYRITNISNTRDNLTWRGAGMRQSVLVTQAGTYMIYNVASNAAFEDLGFDGENVAGLTILLEPPRGGTLRVERCWFYRIAQYGLALQNGQFLVKDSVFENDSTVNGSAGATGITLGAGVKHGRIQDNIFRYLSSGIVGATGDVLSPNDQPSTDMVVSGNYFDLGWYTTIARASGSGGTVSYTGTVLTDTAANFNALTYMAYEPIRIMPIRESGTATTSYTRVTDASATFVANGVQVGEFVRMSGALGIVASVYSETQLEVEEWLSETTRQRIGTPASGAYTVYGVVLGQYVSHTATTLTVVPWHDLNGTIVTPASGTLYEILPGHGNYALLCGRGCKNWTISDNQFIRGWSEQIGYYGSRGLIIGNSARDGLDAGITVQDGDWNVVANNQVYHNGAGGLLIFSADTLVANNIITNSRWTNSTDVAWLADIAVGAPRVQVVNNRVANGSSQPNNRYGISVTTVHVATITDVHMTGNISSGHTVAGYRLDGATGTLSNIEFVQNTSLSETLLDVAGSVGPVAPPTFVVLPAAQTIAAGNTITADACGGVKRITSAGAVTTNTTNTITAPAAVNNGCIMDIVNVGANNITLDHNANIQLTAGADVVLAAGCSVKVYSSGASGVWKQVAAQFCSS